MDFVTPVPHHTYKLLLYLSALLLSILWYVWYSDLFYALFYTLTLRCSSVVLFAKRVFNKYLRLSWLNRAYLLTVGFVPRLYFMYLILSVMFFLKITLLYAAHGSNLLLANVRIPTLPHPRQVARGTQIPI